MSAQLDLLPADVALVDPERGEFAPTPAWLTRGALRMIPGVPDGRILDAGAGLGAMGLEVEAYVATIRNGPTCSATGCPWARVEAVELFQDRCDALPAHWRTHCADLFDFASGSHGIFDLVVTNPPFSLWLDWVSACRSLLLPDGHLLAVGPLALLGGQAREAWWRDHPPVEVRVSGRRPSGPGWDGCREIMVCRWTGAPLAPVGGGLPTRLGWLEVESC